jgi:hypothetical protein
MGIAGPPPTVTAISKPHEPMNPPALPVTEEPDPQLTRLVVRRRPRSGSARLAWAVRAARAWLGPEVRPAPAGMRRYQADLRLRVGDRPSLVTFHKAAYIDFGPIHVADGSWQAEISWRASTLAPLFPVFSGSLSAQDGDITVSGWYSPPGGTVGRLADRALLHLAAEGTARWLLGELDRAAATEGT